MRFLKRPRFGQSSRWQWERARKSCSRPCYHLAFVGRQRKLFADDSFRSFHMGFGGILRKAGILAHGAMLAAAMERSPVVTVEHVRIATTDTLYCRIRAPGKSGARRSYLPSTLGP